MDLIKNIIGTLNQVEVKGKDNLDRLLGAIMALEMILASQNETEKTPAEETTAEGE